MGQKKMLSGRPRDFQVDCKYIFYKQSVKMLDKRVGGKVGGKNNYVKKFAVLFRNYFVMYDDDLNPYKTEVKYDLDKIQAIRSFSNKEKSCIEIKGVKKFKCRQIKFFPGLDRESPTREEEVGYWMSIFGNRELY